MARAHRHYLPGQIWHLTHRCHEREFLLKFAQDRQGWISWLFETKKRFGLCVLDYMVTSNHVHLLVSAQEGRNVIPDSMQLVAGRSGQTYNHRKKRKGAYWEDRYHATAVETGEHLRRCLTHIDLDMVRAGVVAHPKQWPDCGYVEIQQAKARYRIINTERLIEFSGVDCLSQLKEAFLSQVEATLAQRQLERQSYWTESLAVGRPEFVESLQRKLGIRGKGRQIRPIKDGCQLRETETVYGGALEVKKGSLSVDNSLFWNRSH